MRLPDRPRRRARLVALVVAALAAATISPVVLDAAPARAVGWGDQIEVRPGAGIGVGGTDRAVPGLVDAVFASDGVTLLTLSTGPAGSRLGGFTLPDLDPLPAPLADLPGTPVALAVAPDRLNAVVATAAPDALAVVDIATGIVRDTWALPARPTAFVIAPDGGRAYVLSSADRTVAILDLATGLVADELDAGEKPVDIAIDPNGEALWVSDDAATPAVQRWALPSLAHTTMPLWGADAAGDLAVVPAHSMLLALDPVDGRVHVTGTGMTSFVQSFDAFAGTGRGGGRLVVDPEQSSVDVLAGGHRRRFDLLSDYHEISDDLVGADTADLVSPPSAPPKLSDLAVPAAFFAGDTGTFTVEPGVPAPAAYRWQIAGETFTTTAPELTHTFSTAGVVEVTVTALRSATATGGYTGRSFFGIPGDGDSTSGSMYIRPRETLWTYFYGASDTVSYLTLPADTYRVGVTAAGDPGARGADADGYNPDQDYSLGGAGAPGGPGLQVSTTFVVGGKRFVQPGDTLGIVASGSAGNLLGGAGGDGDGNGGDSGNGGNGSGVFLRTTASTQPWIVAAPGGGGGGGGGGFITGKGSNPYGGSAALKGEDTEGQSAQIAGSGDPGISPGLCAPVAEEFHDGPRTADPTQDGGRGADGFASSSAGGAGGGGAGCFAGSGGTEPKYTMGPGGGGGVAYSRYAITASSASTAPGHVSITVTERPGAAQGAQFTMVTTARAIVGSNICIPVFLVGGAIGPVTASGVGWLTLTRVDEYHYDACGTPRPSDAGTAVLHVAATDWGVTSAITIDVDDPAIAAADTEVRAGGAVSIPVTMSDFSSPTATASGLPPGLTYLRSRADGSAGVIQGTVPFGHDGSWPVTLTATDHEATVTREITLHVVSEPDLALAIDGNAATRVGSPIVLRAVVRNHGVDPSLGTVSLDLDLPAGLRATSIGGNGWACQPGTGTCVHAGEVAAGAQLPPIAISATPDAAGAFTVRGTVAADADIDATNDSAVFVVVASAVPAGSGAAAPSPEGAGARAGDDPVPGGADRTTPGPTATDIPDASGSASGPGAQAGSDGSAGAADGHSTPPAAGGFPWWGWLILGLVLLCGLIGVAVAAFRGSRNRRPPR